MTDNIVDEAEVDFEEIESELEQTRSNENKENSPETMAPVRVRLPRKGEVIGIISHRLGGNRMEVNCTDGKTRNCRVPGRYKRSLWLRPKDVVLIELWEYDKDKGDVVFKYIPNAVNQLRKRGLLINIKEEF